MKRFALFYFMLTVGAAFAQVDRNVEKPRLDPDVEVESDAPAVEGQVPNGDNSIYNSAGLEVKPEFPGGMAKFYKFLKNNFKSSDPNLKGRIIVTFIVEKDGNLSGIKVIRDIGNGAGDEIVRLLKAAPRWIPGKQNGKVVRTAFTIPVNIPIEAENIKTQSIPDKK